MGQPGRTGRCLKCFKENIHRPLSAILTLKTFAHTVGAVEAGTQAGRVFGEAWIGLFTTVLTLLVLFLSEINPKTLGVVYWRELAAPVALLLRGTAWLLFPVVVVCQMVNRMLTPKERRRRISHRELAALTEIGVADGVIDEQESTVMKNLLRFRSIQAGDIMTPRMVMQTLPEDATVDEARAHQNNSSWWPTSTATFSAW